MQQAQTISVVITTYNRPDALEAVLEACFAQDDKNFEIIIADDGSAANTRACVERLRAPVPVKHVWQPDQGEQDVCVSVKSELDLLQSLQEAG